MYTTIHALFDHIRVELVANMYTLLPHCVHDKTRLSIHHGVKVNQVHFHCAKAGQNGPVVAWFFDQDKQALGEPTDFNGLAFEGYLTNDDMFEGIFCGGAKIPAADPNDPDKADIQIGGVLVNNIAALYQAMKEGLIYLNVHTVANGPGEVRGQIFVH